MDVAGKVFLVTGASRGIGRGLAHALAEDGARLVLSARTAADLEQAARECRDRGAEALAVAGDVGEDSDARRMVAEALERFGAVDCLVNNAGIISPPRPIVETPPETWTDVLRVNVIGAVNMIRHALPPMQARRSGVVVNVSSGWGRVGERDVAPYCASKFALEAITQSLAEEAGRGVVVFALNPGTVDTSMLRSAWADEAGQFPDAAALAPRWRRLFARLSPAWNGRSLDLTDFRR